VKGGQEKWEVNGRKVRKGLLAWAPSEITYDLTGPDVAILEGPVGIAPANVTAPCGSRFLAMTKSFGRAVS
jgi:hypothetical protein